MSCTNKEPTTPKGNDRRNIFFPVNKIKNTTIKFVSQLIKTIKKISNIICID